MSEKKINKKFKKQLILQKKIMSQVPYYFLTILFLISRVAKVSWLQKIHFKFELQQENCGIFE